MFKRLLATGLAGLMLATALAYPAGARLDEWIVQKRPYENPPAAENTVPNRYLVREGDSLWRIAQEHRVGVETLLELNSIQDPDFIRPGTLLTVPGTGFQHQVREGENLTVIAAMYQVPLTELLRENCLADPDLLVPGQKLRIPATPHGGPAVPAAGWRSLIAPVAGPLTSMFGLREDGQPHYGVDFAADHGAPIRAAEAGRVTFAGPAGTFGLLVVLDHGDGLNTYYAHCSELLVAYGDRVNAGELIARVGDTGRSFGPHLHFEVRWQGQPYDPVLYLSGLDYEV
ncbi:MAG: peptidoglycan DD-metalloendopeptidase family protein [Candidatus Desulforudis sp.]|nr:peptidoglycan DD-metalloendopeptidase family protein [Desulforudis sp.]